jgi:hypothetical protein
MGAAIAGNVNNAVPAKLTRDSAKVKMLSLLPMITLPDSNPTTKVATLGDPTAGRWRAELIEIRVSHFWHE